MRAALHGAARGDSLAGGEAPAAQVIDTQERMEPADIIAAPGGGRGKIATK